MTVAVVGIGAGCSKAAPQSISTKVAAIPVQIAIAVEHRGPDESVLTATLASERQSTISAEVADRITAWPVKVGQKLRTGDLIARLDTNGIAAQVEQARGQVLRANAEEGRLAAEYRRAFQETGAQLDSAEAGIGEAEANRVKADSFSRKQEIHQAEAKLVEAKAEFEFATKEYVRYQDLVAGGAASQQNLDQIQAKYEVSKQQVVLAEESVSLAREGARNEDRAIAKSQVSKAYAALYSAKSRPLRLASIQSSIEAAKGERVSAQASLRQALVQLERHRITAPFDGRVMSVRSELGELATPGSNLIVLGAISRLKVLFSVPESYRAAFQQSQIHFTVDSLAGRSFGATVTAKGFLGDPHTRNFGYEGTVENPDENLLPGMIAKVKLKLGEINAGAEVPVDALIMDGTEASVYVMAGGRSQLRKVLVGERSVDNVLIRDGIRPGDRVIRSPKNIFDGASVIEVTK